MGAQDVDHLLQLRWRTAVEPLIPQTARPAQIEERAQVARLGDEPLARPSQLVLHAGGLQHRQIRHAAGLEHVAERIVTPMQPRGGLIRANPEPHPQREQPAQ